MRYFVTAIGTGSGKTVVSAILCEALGADYWKPIQAGLPRDSDTIRKLVSDVRTAIHPERFLLTMPASPHAAARADGIEISLDDFKAPMTVKPLITEGAGGLLVPLNGKDLMIDLVRQLDMEVILVSNHYLGSINHTLLSVEALQQRQLRIKGIIFNGNANPDTEEVILNRTGLQCLYRLKRENSIQASTILKHASLLKQTLR